ncbi:hypothetical protein SUGI_0132730 [Cryptomeria japonica]|uniref:TMV resistance protein N n=1 Tax=Cryptomeria japonica TaxID=3369 RepID=UPI002408E568|nr:TMV resistance protein N [Cryptomeria japonica]GLJ10670.1 hypothetical protein SUGI_0132730 [Cryptomeria japonica]
MATVYPFQEIVPLSVTADAASSSSGSSTSFDVFINHCGSDVKFTLAASLYDKLSASGVSVFLDVDSLQPGDVIPAKLQQAMRSALLHIAIFSINYAAFPWCLAELSFMLDTGKPIIPVFYHVHPSDLRWVRQGNGIYAAAFSHYENKQRYSTEKVEEWVVALERASFLNGIEVKDNKDERMLLKNIVNMASKILPKAPFLVARNPVGLDDIVLDFERNTAQSEPAENEHNVQVIGIVGMGGAGKTTLAKELFNRKSSSFQRSSFVFAVRDAASRNALHEKQKKLLEDLGVQDLSLDNIEEGKAGLASRLRSVHALIVLDDVDHEEQLDALLPSKDCLASSSLVIVTTRDLHLLAKWGSIMYMMKGLTYYHAKELFCWRAFLQSCPKEGFEDIVEKFLESCSGLPLSLEVFGGLVYGRSKGFWESQLDKISRVLPEDIKRRLKVSYDALDEEEKEMFMDVACFFIGRKKSLAIQVWDGSGWSGLQGWETLVNKCLVNVDGNNDIITMHDHLRDLGRDLAGGHTPSRVWLPEQIMNIQKQDRGGRSIRGIHRSPLEYFDEPLRRRQCLKKLFELIGTSERFFGYPPPSSLGLTFYTGTEEEFIKYFGTPSEDPVWLRLDKFEGRKLLSWSLKKLRILELTYAIRLRELWGNSDPPLQLRELKIVCAYKLQRIPNSIGLLEELKCIDLNYCTALKKLPEEFCGLRSLEWLRLSTCSMLSSLPSRLGDLINMRHLDLSYCKRLQTLPESFKQLRHLQHLILYYCEELTLRSDMLENISNLEYFNFEGCRKLEQLPNQMTHQVRLKELRIVRTGIRQVPSDIGELRKLEVLEIAQSPFLASLPSALGNLSSLTRLSIESPLLTTIPTSLVNQSSLTLLVINSPLLTSLPTFFMDLSCLTTLHLFNCKMLNSLPEIVGSLNMLKMIKIVSTGVSTISITEDSCPSLEWLELHNNDHLRDIQTLPTSMRTLRVSRCKMLKKIMGLRCSANLQFLCIKWCPELNEIASFTDFHSIKEVRIEDCNKVVKIEGLQHSRSLKVEIYSTGVATISISGDSCPSLEALQLGNNGDLVDIQTLPTSLRRLEVSNSKSLKKIMGLRGLANLQSLSISNCSELNEVSSFADFQSIKEVRVKDCDKVMRIEGLENLRSLETLEVKTSWKCQGIQSLEGMEKLERLVMVAENRSAIQRCIQTIKKWPGEMVICGRAVSGAESVMNSLSCPTLTMLPFKKICRSQWEVECAKTNASDAVVVCFLVNSSAYSGFYMNVSGRPVIKDVRLREGKWVIVVVLRQEIDLLFGKVCLYASGRKSEVKRGMMLMGEEGRVLGGITRFWPLFI